MIDRSVEGGGQRMASHDRFEREGSYFAYRRGSIGDRLYVDLVDAMGRHYYGVYLTSKLDRAVASFSMSKVEDALYDGFLGSHGLMDDGALSRISGYRSELLWLIRNDGSPEHAGQYAATHGWDMEDAEGVETLERLCRCAVHFRSGRPISAFVTAQGIDMDEREVGEAARLAWEDLPLAIMRRRGDRAADGVMAGPGGEGAASWLENVIGMDRETFAWDMAAGFRRFFDLGARNAERHLIWNIVRRQN